ncbi:universal stress protein [bacterium]|nr:universal stress protein [bacterium]
MKILFCTDGSDISLVSLENLTHFVSKAVVDVICVIDWSFLPQSMSIEQENYSKTYETLADSVLDYAVGVIKKQNFEIGKLIKTVGSPVEGILEQVSKAKYDMVVMGSHGKKGLQKWLGSVSRQVVSNVMLPTFISKKKIANNKVLFTVDGSEHAFYSVKKALKLLDLNEKNISIISVTERPEFLTFEASMDKNWLDNIDKQQKIHATKAINKSKSILYNGGINVDCDAILTGNIAQKIIDYAKNEEISLIVMGARSKKDLSSILLSSVSKRVLENTTSSVLIIRK